MDAKGIKRIHTGERLAKLRNLMKSEKLEMYIVPSEDSHQSEYIAPCDGRREFISGFSGSAGIAVVSLAQAVLATDGRYFNQASQELDENWTLLKQGIPNVPTWDKWVVQNIKKDQNVGVDASLLTAPAAHSLQKQLEEVGAKLVSCGNLIDKIWSDRPSEPENTVFAHDTKYAGQGIDKKLSDLREFLKNEDAQGIVISMLDEIAWLFNLRGSDIPYNPVFFSYALVTESKAYLYINEKKLNDSARATISSHVEIKPYSDIFTDAKSFSKNKKFLITARSSWALEQAFGATNTKMSKNPILLAKAVKNDAEKKGMRDCHIRDGAALIEYCAWLKNSLARGEKLDEVDAADKLEGFRASKSLFKGLSFPSISSTGGNAAIIHYKPEKGSCDVIDPKKIYLIDSGAQYADGTTDVTRTLHFGEPSKEEIDAYTNVLKGHISLARAVFPQGTTGYVIDALARQHLWADGKDYRHGTGHGVGSFLNVHEGPIGIGPRITFNDTALSEGMVLSNEPGFYKDGEFGIRIENLVLVKEVIANGFGDKPYFGFENLTMAPMCKSLINKDLLSASDKEWLNQYHKEVLEKVKPLIENNEEAMSYLQSECEPY